MSKPLLPTQEIDINVELPPTKDIELPVTKEEDAATSTEEPTEPPSVIISTAITSWFASSILWIIVAGLIHAKKNSKIDCGPQGGSNVSGFYGPGIRTAWLFIVFASIADQGFSKQPRQKEEGRFLPNLDLNIILAFAYPCIAAVDILYHYPILWNSNTPALELSTYGPLLAGMLVVLSGASFGVGILAIIYLQDWRRGSSSRLTIVLTIATTAFLVIVSKLCFFAIYGPSTRSPALSLALSFVTPTFASTFPATPRIFLNSKTCFGRVKVFFDWLDVSDLTYGFLSPWIVTRTVLGGMVIQAFFGQIKTHGDNPSWSTRCKRILKQLAPVPFAITWIANYLTVHFWKLFLVIGYCIYDPQVMAPITPFPITDHYQMSTLICSGAFVAYGIWKQLRNKSEDEITSGMAFFIIGPLFPLIIVCIIGTVIYKLISKLFALPFRRRENTSEV